MALTCMSETMFMKKVRDIRTVISRVTCINYQNLKGQSHGFFRVPRINKRKINRSHLMFIQVKKSYFVALSLQVHFCFTEYWLLHFLLFNDRNLGLQKIFQLTISGFLDICACILLKNSALLPFRLNPEES